MGFLFVVCCREGCSTEEFEGLIQRNMAANCSMDYAFMADFMTSIREQEQQALRCVLVVCCQRLGAYKSAIVCLGACDSCLLS